MNMLFRLGRRSLYRVHLPPRVIRNRGFSSLDPAVKVEEEAMPDYENGLFYPVRMGEKFQNRYQVLTKLGFGANSTVWLCRDSYQSQYTALKVHTSCPSTRREAEVLTYLASIKSTHPGKDKFRRLLDVFEIDGPDGSHQCLAHEPHLMSLLHLQSTLLDQKIPEDMLKLLLEELLVTLDYLHSEAHVIHTDIQSKNIMIGTTDPSIFEEWESQENEDPTPRKVTDKYTVYYSRPFYPRKDWRGWGLPILSDFGAARIGNKKHEGLIQPALYRAPEVVLGMEWSSKVDIWNLGVLIWDLFQRRHMFDGRGPDRKYSNAHMLAEMISLLGQPAPEFLKRSTESLKYWDESGIWRGLVEIPDISLEDSEDYLEGVNKELFMQFMRKMLTWDPEERHSARELLDHPWLNS